LSEEKKQERIADMLDDDEWYDANIKTKAAEFTNQPVFASIDYMKTKNILD
jgi:hypothetical protein